MKLSQQTLHSVLDYDPDTGIFTWRWREDVQLRINRKMAGKQAGSLNNKGYIRIRINGKRYLAHVLAVIYMNGRLTNECIHHINGNRADNRWANLQETTHKDNVRRARPGTRNHTGIIGVTYNKETRKYRARIKEDTENEKLILLTSDFFEACCARKSAENQRQWRA